MSEASITKMATPPAELRRHIMNPNVPKNEREWWARDEIERLLGVLRWIQDHSNDPGVVREAGRALVAAEDDAST